MAYKTSIDKRKKAVWRAMMSRCYSKKNPYYYNYGGRGIKVCERWHNFDNYLLDMDESFSEGLTLERIDNNGDYEPGNCTWATRTEQAFNRRTTTSIEIDGIKQPLTIWIRQLGLKASTVKQRYYVYGWSIERALGLQ